MSDFDIMMELIDENVFADDEIDDECGDVGSFDTDDDYMDDECFTEDDDEEDESDDAVFDVNDIDDECDNC